MKRWLVAMVALTAMVAAACTAGGESAAPVGDRHRFRGLS